MVLCIQQSTAVQSATRCSSIIESALQTSSHVYTMQHKRMRQAIGCRSVPQLQTLWVNMIYIFVIYTNICIYNVFVYGGQWPHVLCIFTLHLSIRSLWASSASCACLFWACLLAIMCISIICVSVMCVSILGKSGCLHHKVRRRPACRETGFTALLSERRRGGVQAAV